jgi:hypothetical protein
MVVLSALANMISTAASFDAIKNPTPKYQAVLEASLANQMAGGQDGDNLTICRTNGMPRMMSAAPVEFFILPNITYVHFEVFMPGRICTDGRHFPKDAEPGYMGYSIGKWLDTDGRLDALEVETCNFKGPRTCEGNGIPLRTDNQSIKECIFLDKTDRDILHDEITVEEHALTRPWTVDKRYHRIHDVLSYEDNCTEDNHYVIGKEGYFVSGDGYLMASRKGRAPPDLRYFETQK